MQTLSPIKNDFLSQETDIGIVIQLIPYLKKHTFLDIGAEKGIFTEILFSYGLNGACFEPLPKHETILRNLEKKTGCTYFPYAIDASDHEANFYIACDDKNNPLDYFHSLQKLNHDTRVKHNQVVRVACKSLNSLLHSGFVEKHIGIVKTDTEGNDLNVMEGMSDIVTEVLICEFFMPGVYNGWEQGHPLSLIEQAKKLGFDHFIAIKRIQQFEQVSIDNPLFIHGQWGNLIFLNNTIFHQASKILNNIINEKEISLINHFLSEVNTLNGICREREQLIQQLHNECENRLRIIEQLQIEVAK